MNCKNTINCKNKYHNDHLIQVKAILLLDKDAFVYQDNPLIAN